MKTIRKILIMMIFVVSLFFMINNDIKLSASSIFDTIYMNKAKDDNIIAEIEKTHYQSNEEINLSFDVNSEYDIVNYSLDSDNFEVINKRKIDKIIDVTMILNTIVDYPTLKVNVELSNSNILQCNIYGYLNNYGLFISSISHSDAKQKYYEYAYCNNLMTIVEIENSINNDILQNIIIEKSDKTIQTRSLIAELNTRLLWEDDSKVTHGLAYTKFEIIEHNPSEGTSTTTYYTDSQGYFPDGIFVNTSSNLKIKVYTAGENTEVRKETFLGINSQWVDINDFSENTISITFRMSDSYDFGRAQQVSQALIYANKYAEVINGSKLSFVTAYYPASKTNYNPLTNKIRILGEGSDLDYADWDVIMHEYGHHVASELNIDNSPGLEHSLGENLADRYNKSQGIRLAWSEAVATIFSGMAQEYYYEDLKTIKYAADGGYSDNYLWYYYNDITDALGEASEGTIIGLLWDLYDSDSGESFDQCDFSHLEFWSILKNSEATTLSEFIEYYYSEFTNVSDREKLGKILEYYKVAPENIHLSTNSSDLNYNIPTFQWIANGTSSTLQNNKFIVRILSDDCTKFMDISTTNCSLMLTEEQWNTILNWPCKQIMVIVFGFQEDSPKTGPYGQGYTYFNKPQFKISSLGESVSIVGLYYDSLYLDIPSQINGKQVVSIQNSAFKNNNNILVVKIPNSVTNIDSSAFENCYYLQSVTLSNNLTSIGSSVFKNCYNLMSIIIPNSVTHIDSSTFEGCTNLNNILLSNHLYAIGIKAFKGCINLPSLILPSSVEYIDNEAFMNCSSLSIVTVNRTTTGITNLGGKVFDGCHNDLQIIVPIDRIAEYKNKEYWSSYRNKIVTLDEFTEFEIDCESRLNNGISLNESYNKLYKVNVNCSKSYKINTTSSSDVNIITYNANMNVIENSTNSSDIFLSYGIYYVSFEFVDPKAMGQIEISITLRWPSSDILIPIGTTNMKTSIHNTIDNKCHGTFYFLNNTGAGFFRIYLNAGTNASYPEGTIQIYDDSNRTSLLNRFGLDDKTNLSSSNQDENEMYIYLPQNGCYYISIDLPTSNYSSIMFTIEEVAKETMNYSSSLANMGFSELFFNKTSQSYFEEITISHRSKLELDIVTNGMIQDNIPVCILEKQCDLGYEAGDEHYYIVEKLKADITNIDKSPIFSIILDPGTYYIGYANNFKDVSIQCGLRRIVNQDVNINGVLVTDPAHNQGYPLGSEVTFNHGVLGGNTITEGFTRNIYLMVEDRLRDPMSRLEYDWYSSDENVAKVTAYGTVLGLYVTKDTNVIIYAINKKDPSIVYQKEFTILKEIKTEEIIIESNMSYSYTEENGLYTLELDFTNSPYPYIGYYVWDIECLSDMSVDMEHHHLITSTGPGEAILTANYTLNTRVVLIIHFAITE